MKLTEVERLALEEALLALQRLCVSLEEPDPSEESDLSCIPNL